MRHPIRWLTGATVLVAALLVATWTGVTRLAYAAPGAHGPDGEHLDSAGGTAAGGGLARLPDGSVNLPKPAQRRMQVRTVLARESEGAMTVELPARVVTDPNASGRVQAVHGGRLEPGPRGLPVPGQAVRQGEVLAYVQHHPDPYALAQQQAQFADARAVRRIAEQRLRRLEDLEGTVPRKEIESARAQLESLTERERSLGNSLSAKEALVAPVTGVLARSEAAAGRVVEPRDVLFEIVDPRRLLVEATTADPALAGRIAGAHLVGTPQASLRLLGGARMLRDGVLPLTFAVTAAAAKGDLPLAIGQPVTVLAAMKERIRGYVLPAEAVVRNPANEPVVWIKSGAERYIPQPVQFRALDAASVVVTRGLGADNRVVVRGASLIAQIR